MYGLFLEQKIDSMNDTYDWKITMYLVLFTIL